MAAASPVMPDMAIAGAAVPSSAVQSVLPCADQVRSAVTRSHSATSGGDRSTMGRGDINITGVTPDMQASFKQLLQEHQRELKRLIAGEDVHQNRT